ncbi:zinc transport system substrate-binding protein [Halopseudomonas litoralis]|uniref:High-affinity zinc uptake system protein ZnuA n=1 Tax=Halopseudomonas litoralis TaxID=797277 RepID=A0A1H1X175_9GAMM|nr:zinc ABC transporter substrate-binding protein ZnuA [Halopseudomonas litoralis]SDT02821.1 zinc transport system substrate-binding protein [Halopseudomonas litoralis]
MLPRFLFALACTLSMSMSAMAATPSVLTTIKPVQLIAAAVLDGVAEPDVLLPPGASPHNYALRPSDRRRIASADRLYWVGPDLERFLQQLLDSQPRARRLDVISGVTLRSFDDAHQHADEHDEHGHDTQHSAHEHDDHQHAPGSRDPHIWLSVRNAQHIAQWMATDLAGLYPEHGERLQRNAADFIQRLDQLHERQRQRLQPLADKPYFVFHDAYGYLQDSLGVHPRGVFTLSEEIQPGARHVNTLRQQLTAAGPSCVFREPQFPARRAETITAGLPVRSAELDPLGMDITPNAQGYEQLLETLGNTLASCLEKL